MTYKNELNILFAYRLNDSREIRTIKLNALTKKKSYQIEYWDGRKNILFESGEKLMEEGIRVEIPEKYEAVAMTFR